MDNPKIIILQDLIDARKRKQEELEFYTRRKEELEGKLFWIQKEIQLTDFILNLIEQEKITEIKRDV